MNLKFLESSMEDYKVLRNPNIIADTLEDIEREGLCLLAGRKKKEVGQSAVVEKEPTKVFNIMTTLPMPIEEVESEEEISTLEVKMAKGDWEAPAPMVKVESKPAQDNKGVPEGRGDIEDKFLKLISSSMVKIEENLPDPVKAYGKFVAGVAIALGFGVIIEKMS